MDVEQNDTERIQFYDLAHIAQPLPTMIHISHCHGERRQPLIARTWRTPSFTLPSAGLRLKHLYFPISGSGPLLSVYTTAVDLPWGTFLVKRDAWPQSSIVQVHHSNIRALPVFCPTWRSISLRGGVGVSQK